MMTHPRAARAWATTAIAGVLAVVTGVPASAQEDPDLDQEIDSGQEIVTDQVVLADGHVDIGPRYVDDEWTLFVHDDTAAPPVWRTMDAAVFQISDAALEEVPDSEAYSFLPAPPGTEVHVVPQAQQPDVVWVGWNTQEPTVIETIDRGATLRLHGVDGPGEMVMFLQSGDLGEPEVLWDSRQEYPQDVWVEVNTHTHANWVFSEPGVYLVEVEVAADLVTGETASDTQVLRFAVGEETSTDEAFQAEYATAEEAADAEDADSDTGDDDARGDAAQDTNDSADDAAGGVTTGVLVAVGAAVVLAIAVAVVVVRSRTVKKRAEAERAAAAGGPEGGA